MQTRNTLPTVQKREAIRLMLQGQVPNYLSILLRIATKATAQRG